MTKNEQIKQSILLTKARRQNQILKVYELKVNCHNTSKEDFKKLDFMLIQTKWIQNDCIASDDVFKYNYKDHRIVKNFDKDHNLVERKINIQTGIHQQIITKIQ